MYWRKVQQMPVLAMNHVKVTTRMVAPWVPKTVIRHMNPQGHGKKSKIFNYCDLITKFWSSHQQLFTRRKVRVVFDRGKHTDSLITPLHTSIGYFLRQVKRLRNNLY